MTVYARSEISQSSEISLDTGHMPSKGTFFPKCLLLFLKECLEIKYNGIIIMKIVKPGAIERQNKTYVKLTRMTTLKFLLERVRMRTVGHISKTVAT